MLWPSRFLKWTSLKVWRTKQEISGDLRFFIVEALSAVCLWPKEMIIFSNDVLILNKLALMCLKYQLKIIKNIKWLITCFPYPASHNEKSQCKFEDPIFQKCRNLLCPVMTCYKCYIQLFGTTYFIIGVLPEINGMNANSLFKLIIQILVHWL